MFVPILETGFQDLDLALRALPLLRPPTRRANRPHNRHPLAANTFTEKSDPLNFRRSPQTLRSHGTDRLS